MSSINSIKDFVKEIGGVPSRANIVRVVLAARGLTYKDAAGMLGWSAKQFNNKVINSLSYDLLEKLILVFTSEKADAEEKADEFILAYLKEKRRRAEIYANKYADKIIEEVRMQEEREAWY